MFGLKTLVIAYVGKAGGVGEWARARDTAGLWLG